MVCRQATTREILWRHPRSVRRRRKEERQREFDRQVDTGSLVVRQMTDEEREKYAESPKAAEERRARRARNRK